MKPHFSVAVIIGALMLLDNHPASPQTALLVAPANGATFNRERNQPCNQTFTQPKRA